MRTALLLAVVFLVASCSSPQPREPRPTRPSPVPGRGPDNVIPSTALPVGGCDDAPLFTLEQMARGEGAGERIALDVVPQAQIACTLLACYTKDDKEAECCNQCGGSYGASLGLEIRVFFEGVTGRCGGWDCNIHCEPFGIRPTTKYRFVGKNEWTKRRTNGAVYDKSMFTVEKFCRVE